MKNGKIFKIHFKRIITKILIIYLIVVFLFKLINIQNNNIKKQKELNELNNKVETKTKENEYLKHQIKSGMTDEYKEQYARENLNMTKSGERVIFDVTKE